MAPFKDDDLLSLIRMAGEAERFEREAAGISEEASPARLRLAGVGEFPARRVAVNVWRRRIGYAGLLAASLGMAWVLWTGGGAQGGRKPQSMKLAANDAAKLKPGDRFTTAEGVPCVVLAIFKDSNGTQQCVDVTVHQLDSKSGLSGLDAKTLMASASAGNDSCMERPDRLLIVAVAGPLDKLPGSEEEVRQLTACVTDSSRVCEEDLSSYERAAQSCLPSGLTVVADMLSL